MKRITFLKSLLLAAGLMVGSSAWADDVVFTQVANYDFTADGATDPFVNKTWDNRQTSTLTDDAQLGTKAVVFSGSNLAGKTSGFHVLDFSSLTASSSQVKVEFDFYVNSSNCDRFALRDATIAAEPTKDTWIGTGAIFSIGAARVSKTNYFGYNGSAISGAAFATPYHVCIIVDMVNKKVSYTLTKLSDNSTVASGSNINFTDANATACTQLDFHGSTNATMAAINNIVISEYTSASATTYSIIKYDKDGNELACISNLAGVSGETSSASDADKATFYSADTNNKYVYDATDSRNVSSLELTSNESTNVLKLYFDTYAKYTATVHSVCGTNTVADITGSWYADGNPVTLYWPKVVRCDDGYYIVDAQAAEPLYGHTFSSSDLSKTVTYSLDESIVYYAEYENICGKITSYTYFSEKSSKGGTKILTGNNVMKSNMGLTNNGVYNVTISGGNRDGAHTATLELKLIDSNNNVSTDAILSQSFSSGQWIGEMTANNVFIPAGSELYVANDNGDGNAKFAGDYIIVKKSKVSVIVANEYATYANHDFALDFTDVEGLTAYTATVKDANTVTFTPAKKVPAGTGLLLKGATADVPVIASAEEITGNVLYAPTEEVTGLTYEDDTYYNYILTKVSDKVGFYKANNNKVAVGKAYLRIPKTDLARELTFIGFDDDDTTTGIEAIDNSRMTMDNVYNIQGQRVNQPQKGLYIVNGKKVIIK